MEDLFKYVLKLILTGVALLITAASANGSIECFDSGRTREGWSLVATSMAAFGVMMFITLCWR